MGLVSENVTMQVVDVTGKMYPTVSLVALPQLSKQAVAVTSSPEGGVISRMVALGVAICKENVYVVASFR